MSDYTRALENREDHLERARAALDQAASDAFLDRAQENILDEAQRKVEDVLMATQDELAVLDADWRLIEDHAETIFDELVDVAQTLDEHGLVHFDEEHGELSAALDDEPTELTDARRYIDRALDDWYEVRMAASEVLEDGGRR